MRVCVCVSEGLGGSERCDSFACLCTCARSSVGLSPLAVVLGVCVSMHILPVAICVHEASPISVSLSLIATAVVVAMSLPVAGVVASSSAVTLSSAVLVELLTASTPALAQEQPSLALHSSRVTDEGVVEEEGVASTVAACMQRPSRNARDQRVRARHGLLRRNLHVDCQSQEAVTGLAAAE